MSFQFVTAARQTEDPPRHEPRVKIRVVNTRSGTHIPGQYKPLDGTPDDPREYVLTIYESDLPTVNALVETDFDMIEAAREADEGEFFEEVVSTIGEDQANAYLEQDPSEWPKELRDRIAILKARWPGSMEAMFHEAQKGKKGGSAFGRGRGVKPLLKVEVLEHLPPPTTEQYAIMRDMVQAVVPQPQGNIAEVEALRAQVARNEAELASLKAMFGGFAGEYKSDDAAPKTKK